MTLLLTLKYDECVDSHLTLSFWLSYILRSNLQYRGHMFYSSRILNNLYKKLKMTDPISPDYTIMQINLKTYNNILKTSIQALKKSYSETLFNKFKNDIRGTWKTINSILNKTNTKKNIPQLFKDNEKTITDKIAIANKFNTFFTSIGPDLAHKISNIQIKVLKIT